MLKRVHIWVKHKLCPSAYLPSTLKTLPRQLTKKTPKTNLGGDRLATVEVPELKSGGVVQGAQYNGLLVTSRLAKNYVFLDRKYAVQYNTQFSILVYSVPATSTIVSSVIYHYICGITTQFVALLWL